MPHQLNQRADGLMAFAAIGHPARESTPDPTRASMQRTQFDFIDDIMASLSIRGLDAKALADLKARAAKEDASVNTLVLRLIEQSLGHNRARPALRRHEDLDELAGTWRKAEGAEFERATAPLRKVDRQLWK